MDEKDRLLLAHLQKGISLESQPFQILARQIGEDPADILMRTQRLTRDGFMAGIKAVLVPQKFCYQSAWIAMCFKPQDLVANTEIILQHPGVIYACERDHEFNFWFFLTTPAHHDLELHVSCLEKLSRAKETLFLPIRHVYKGTDFLNSLDATTFAEFPEQFEKRRERSAADLTQGEMEMVRRLQEVFPLTDQPYQKMAQEMGISEAMVLQRLKSLMQKGMLRRIGSVARVPGADSQLKNLVVWQIPEERLRPMGPRISEFQEVLYADARPSYPEFPYSFYTIIQAAHAAEVEVVARRMQDRIGRWPHRMISIVQEFKKIGIKYFPKALDVWLEQGRFVVNHPFDPVEI